MFFWIEVQESTFATIGTGALPLPTYSMGQSSHRAKPKVKGHGSTLCPCEHCSKSVEARKGSLLEAIIQPFISDGRETKEKV